MHAAPRPVAGCRRPRHEASCMIAERQEDVESASHGCMNGVMPRTIVRRARCGTWLTVAALGGLASVRPALIRPIVFALVGTVGIAHGATDVDALDRSGVRPPGGRQSLSVGYGVLALATFLVARRFERLAGVALFALSVWHFGSGDADFARACGAKPRGWREALLRGLVPLCVRGTAPRSAAIAALALGRAALHAREGAAADALDVALPAALLLAVPTRLGFGIYFGSWHSVRHTALLLERDARAGHERARLGRFARESAPNAAVAALAGVAAAALDRVVGRGRPAASAADEARREAIFGALVLAITVPHQIAVSLLERRAIADAAV